MQGDERQEVRQAEEAEARRQAEEIFNKCKNDEEEFGKEIQEKEIYNNAYNEAFGNFQRILSEIEPISEKKIKELKNIVLTSPTQVGKTDAILNSIPTEYSGTITVISCDNKNDQCSQMLSRMGIKGIDVVEVTNVTHDIDIKKLIIDAKTKNLTFLLLNNKSQVKKLNSIIHDIMDKVEFRCYQVFHDEADLVNKNDTTGEVDIGDAESHKAWIDHFESLKCFKIERFKRIWVSATPENCNLLHDVYAKDVIILPKPLNYRQVSEHIRWEASNLDAIKKEVDRITEEQSNEVILYCTDIKNSVQELVVETFKNNFDCPIVLYNGKGIYIYDILGKEKFEGSISNCLGTISNRPATISNCLTTITKKYKGPVIVVGYKLMDRGISFVSDNRTSGTPASATVMFYTGSNTIHTVSISQRLGRITGSSRPDINRRVVYCSDSIYESFKTYLKNQSTIYNNIRKPENKEVLVSELIKNLSLEKINRNVDNPKLKKVNKTYKDSCDSGISDTSESTDDIIDGVRLEKLREMLKNTDKYIAGKLIKFLYTANKVISKEEFKLGISYEGSDEAFCSNLDNSKGLNTKYGKLWIVRNNHQEIKINPRIKKYLDTL